MKNDNNKLRVMIRTMMAEQGVTMKQVAELINEKYPNPDDPVKATDITNKLQRQTLRLNEAIRIADVLGYDIVLKKRGLDPDTDFKTNLLEYAIRLLQEDQGKTV